MENKDKTCCQAMHGWQVKKTYDINIPKATVLELEHIKTGAKYIHVATDNKENVFVVAFKTVPTNATGVAHILEHTVLTGSEKYPIRNPFFNIIKRSLQTYINAFTFVDWTAYPIASPNKKDFYNLMSIYLDATFFPKLKELNFLQEGWRHSFDNEKLKYDGVVYNEMKGSMSSPSRHMEESLMSALHNEVPYHYNSGGDPACIPDLSYEEFKTFHKKHYHPSNAYFYSYGDLPLSDHLQMINKNVINRFKKSDKIIKIKKENRWDKPKTHKYFYPISSDKNVDDKCQIALSWLTCGANENLEVFSLELLEDILLGNPASPLRKALLDSGLGSDLCDTVGYESEIKDTHFVFGLKDTNEGSAEKIKDIILSCLQSLVENGIDKELITSVVNSNEIRKKNITNQPYPYGLQVFLNILSPWIHDGSVNEVLQFEQLLKIIKEKIKEGNYFENLIEKYFLNNNHRTLFILAPDNKMQDRLDKQAEKRLEETLDALSKEDKYRIKENSRLLNKLQTVKEDLSCLPSLELTDVDQDIDRVQEDKRSSSNVSIYSKNTSGLLHFTGAYDTSGLDDGLIKLVPLFSYLLPRMSTKKRGYQSLAKKIDSLTGGVSVVERATRYYGEEQQSAEFMIMQTYGLEKNSLAIFDLVKEIIGDFDFSDAKRVKMLFSAMDSQFQASIVEQGHMYAAHKALSPFSCSAELTEAWHGLEQIDFLNKIKDKDANELNNSLNDVGSYFQQKANSHVALIGEESSLLDARDSLGKLMVNREEKIKKYVKKDGLRQAYQVSSAVSFVVAAMEVPDISHVDAPALMVASKILARGFLHNEIREKRGAYGGFAKYDHYEGTWWFGSYRDPHIVSTLDVFARAKDHMKTEKYSKKNIEEAIISLSTDIDKPGTEVEQTKKAFSRKLIGLKDETRQLFKDNLLKVTGDDVARVSEKYLKDNWHDYSVVVISSKEKIDSANLKLGEWGLNISAL